MAQIFREWMLCLSVCGLISGDPCIHTMGCAQALFLQLGEKMAPVQILWKSVQWWPGILWKDLLDCVLEMGFRAWPFSSASWLAFWVIGVILNLCWCEKRENQPLLPTLAHNEELPAQFTVSSHLFSPSYSSNTYVIYEKQILPDGSCRCHLICGDDGPVVVGETEWKREAVAKLLLFVGCLHLPLSVYYPRW